MIYPTRLLTFYWQKLGYENFNLSKQFANVERDNKGLASTTFATVAEVESTRGLSKKSPRNQNSMGQA